MKRLLSRNWLAILGLILFIGGIAIGGYLIIGYTRAVALNSYTVTPAPSFCSNILWKANLPNRVMSEDETQALTVSVSSEDTADCEEDVFLDAPNFTISRSDRTLTLPSMHAVTLVWILAPQKVGTFTINVEIDPPFQTETLGITVTNVFGLTSWQAQLLAYIGTILGPILTVTWWYEKWQERKKKKSEAVLVPNKSASHSKPKRKRKH